MNLPTALLTIRWMIHDTLRQSLASRLFWVMLGISLLCVVFCLSISVQGDDRLPILPGDTPLGLPKDDELTKKLGVEKLKQEGIDVLQGELSIGFGAFNVKTRRDRLDSVRFIQIWLAGLIAGTAGIFLTIIWTAGFLPTFLDPNHATVLLTKPVPRWSLLVGKVLGVLAFVGIQASIFVGGTWLALGIRTGIFDGRYLLAIPLLLFHFGVFYSFSAMLAVWTRSTVVCVFGSLVFWMVCWGMNFGRHSAHAHPMEGMSRGSHFMMEVGYWVLPKPGDLNMIMDDALETDGFTAGVPEFKILKDRNELSLELSALASLLFSLAMLGVATHELKQLDY